jgi:hypothetical protein
MKLHDLPGLVLYVLLFVAIALKACATCQSSHADDVSVPS